MTVLENLRSWTSERANHGVTARNPTTSFTNKLLICYSWFYNEQFANSTQVGLGAVVTQFDILTILLVKKCLYIPQRRFLRNTGYSNRE